MSYRTSLPLHETEDSSSKPVKVVGENVSDIKRDRMGKRYVSVVESTAYLKAGTKIYGINKKAHQTTNKGEVFKDRILGGDYKATRVGKRWKLLK